MRVKRFAAAAVLLFPAIASADPCPVGSPFSDVPASANYCTNTEWLKNRTITLGCTSATLFCPNDVVTRASMALFMNRLGVALSPRHLYAEETLGGFTFSTFEGDKVCKTANVAPANYPRSALVTATYSPLSTTAMVHSSRVMYSTDGGATFSIGSLTVIRMAHPGADWGATTSHASLSIPAGTQIMFATQFYRESFGGDIASARCQLVAVVVNDNGTSSPFDHRLPDSYPTSGGSER